MVAYPDPPVTCLPITTPPPQDPCHAFRHRSSRMKTTITTPIPLPTSHTRRTHPAPMVSLPQPEGAGRGWRSPELSIPPPCRHGYCTQLPTITTITISKRIMGRNSSKAPWSWTCMIRFVWDIYIFVCVCFFCVWLHIYSLISIQLQQASVPVSYTVTQVPPHGLAAPLCSGQHLPPTCSSQQQVPACSVVFSTGQHYHPVR